MSSDSTPLDPVLDFLEGRSHNQELATRQLRAYLLKSGRNKTDNAGAKLAALLLTACVKPLFLGDLEQQSAMDRLAHRIREANLAEEYRPLRDEVDKVAHALEPSAGVVVLGSRMRESLPQLLAAIKSLVATGEWMEAEALALIERCPGILGPSFWEDLLDYGQRVAATGHSHREAWMGERRGLLKLVTDLAQRFKEVRQTADPFHSHLEELINLMQNNRTLQDLSEIESLVVREAEELKNHTLHLSRQLEENQKRLHETQERLEELEVELARSRAESLTDPLTGIANRRALDAQLQREMSRSRRHDLPLSFVLFDLDFFKRINDTHGHGVGDKVLINVAERAGRSLRQADFLARFGGEEFAVVLPETPLAAAIKVADKIRQDFTAIRFKTGEHLLVITASFGVCRYCDAHETMEQFIQCADDALYQAKEKGRNRVVAAARGEGEGVIAS